jgi:hypothetical protein
MRPHGGIRQHCGNLIQIAKAQQQFGGVIILYFNRISHFAEHGTVLTELDATGVGEFTGDHGQPFPLQVRETPGQSVSVLVFQAGHASSILVTRSASSLLVKSLSGPSNYSNNRMTRMTRLAIRFP